MATIPTNPSDGDTFTDGAGVTWTYNSSSNKWLIPVATASSGSAGGGGALFSSAGFAPGSTGTYTAPRDATYYILAVGGGGGGASNDAGGGGGSVLHTVDLTAGDTLTINAGSGGGLGANGGNTTVTGGGVDITAGGGTPTAGGIATGGSIANEPGDATQTGFGNSNNAVADTDRQAWRLPGGGALSGYGRGQHNGQGLQGLVNIVGIF